MKLLNILLFLMFSVMAATASEISFDQFASDHKRQYSSAAEKQKRKGIYTNNMKNIDKLNKEAALKGSSARFGVTKFADLEQAELEKNKMGFKVSSLNKKNIKLGKTKTTKKTTTKTKPKQLPKQQPKQLQSQPKQPQPRPQPKLLLPLQALHLTGLNKKELYPQ